MENILFFGLFRFTLAKFLKIRHMESMCIFTSDRLRQEYEKDNQGVKFLTPEDFGEVSPEELEVRGKLGWLAPWHLILTEGLLKKIHAEFPFSRAVYWNYFEGLNSFCVQNNIQTMYQELGLIRNPALYQYDYRGLLWTSSLPKKYKESRGQPDLAWLDALKQEVSKQNCTLTRGQVFERYKLDPTKPLVVVPFQVESDSNILEGSPFKTMREFHTFCSSVIDSSRYEVLYKSHPEQSDLILEGKFAGMEINSYDLVKAADYILTINSTVGFEGLLFGKKVIALGKSAYRVEDLVFTSEFTSLDQTDAFFKETSPEALNRFLTLALKTYHLTEDEHVDPTTYSRPWD